MTTKVTSQPSLFANGASRVNLLESEIFTAWNSGQFEKKLLHYAALYPRTQEHVSTIRAYLQFSNQRSYRFCRETLSLLLRNLSETALPELRDLLTQYVSMPLSSSEWNEAFALSRSLECLNDTFPLLIEQLPPIDEATQLVEWISTLTDDHSGFKQLGELFIKHPAVTMDILYDESVTDDDGTLPLFDHLIAHSKKEPLLAFISLVQNHLRVDSFYALIQQTPEFHPFAQTILKNHLSEEFPSYPDLGVDELNFALSTGDIDTALTLIDAGVSLDQAGEHPRTGFELYFDWFFENLIMDVPLDKLCKLFFSGDSLDRLFENDHYELKLFFYIWGLLLRDSSYPERERNVPIVIAIVENLLRRAQSEPRLIDPLGVLISSAVRMQRHNQSAYYDSILTSERLSSFPHILRLLPFVAPDGDSNTLFPKVDGENLILLNDLIPNLEPLPYGFSPLTLCFLLNRNPQIFTEILTSKGKNDKSVLDNMWCLKDSKPNLRIEIYFILLSFFAHFELLNDDDDLNNLTILFKDLDEGDHAQLFRKCLEQNRWDLANRMALFFWELEEEDEPDYNYLEIWGKVLADYVAQGAPFLTPKIVSEFLQFIICNLESTHINLNENDLIIKLLRAIAAHPENGDLQLAFIPSLLEIRHILSLKTPLEGINLSHFTSELGLNEISTALTPNIQEFFDPWPDKLFQTPVTSVILMLPQILKIATEVDKPYIALYFQIFFDRKTSLPHAYANLLNDYLRQDAFLQSVWEHSPLFRFHYNLQSADTLEKVLPDLSPSDFCFDYVELPPLLSYLTALDRRSVESFMLKHIDDLIAKNIPVRGLFQMAVRLKCYGVIAYLLDHHHQSLTESEFRHCVEESPLALLILLKNSTIEQYISQKLSYTHGYNSEQIRQLKEELSQSHMSRIISTSYEKNMYTPAISASCSPHLAIKARPLQSKILSEIAKSPLLQTMGHWLQRGSETPFKSIPLKLLYDYVTEKITKDQFLNGINYIELAPFIQVLMTEINVLKTKIKESM